MDGEENGLFGEERSTITIRDRLNKYIANWPLFLICLFFCVGIGIFYSRYTVPKYIATTSFLIKGAEGGSSNSNDLVESSVNGKQQVNQNNDILMVSSSNLMERTVAKNGFNVSYYKKGKLLTLNIYKDAPFLLTARQITDSNQTYTFYLKRIDASGGFFSLGLEEEVKSNNFHWNVPFTINNQTFVFEPRGQIHNDAAEYIAQWEPVDIAANQLSSQLSVKASDPKTSVIDLTIKTENLQLGKDILNGLFAEFNLSDTEDRNKLSATTVQFIDDRLLNISGELKGVEGHLENYQGRNELVDVRGQSSQSMENSNSVSKTIKDLAIQQGIVEMILEYFSNPTNNNRLVPSSMGLNDATLASLITQYNDLQLKKEREAPSVATNSTVMQDLNTQLQNLKQSILESLNNISKNLKLQENNFQQRSNQYQNFLSSVPHNERVLQEIKRKQSITEGLYLYLLQKREEAAISSTAANVAHFKLIDPAKGYGPVEPNKKNIILYSTLLGFFLAGGLIYIRDLLNDKVITREDIVKNVSSPVIGQINHIPKRKKQLISVLERNVAGEQFRTIRTQISFLLKDVTPKTILVTSCSSGEGKSFVSLNLAAVCAMPGKKVALLEFDIRKPVITENLKLHHEKGLSDYLVGKIDNLSEICQVIEEIPSLHLYPCGIVPSNPGDLLLTENVSKLFELLKQEYDYIIVDSPPAELVSDAFILEQYCDVVVFIIRQRVTLKKRLNFIHDIVSNQKLKKTTLVLNDIKTGKKYGYDDYGYEEYAQTIKKKKFKIVG